MIPNYCNLHAMFASLFRRGGNLAVRAEGAGSVFSGLGPMRNQAQSRVRHVCLFFVTAAFTFGLIFPVALTTGCSAPSSSSLSSASSARGEAVDAVLPSSTGWILFRLSGQRYARLSTEGNLWKDTTGGMGVSWRMIPSPEGSFRPVQVVSAARGYFYLVDGASSRLCLFDSAFGLISTYPLPERFTPFASGRAAVFRGSDGGFVFADYATGEAFLYTDREGTEGARFWMLRARTKMPVGWRDCVQQPGSDEIACKAAGGAARFDGSLNRIPAGGEAKAVPTDPSLSGPEVSADPSADPSSDGPARVPSARLAWDPEAREWTLEGSSATGARLFLFRPLRGRLERLGPQ